MCGIAGVVDLRGERRLPEPHVIDAMTDALAHRGPDGRGVWRTENAAFGHRRLAILDPTPAGAQPMLSRAKPGLGITFNGEIYNFRELRRDLVALGHAFHTECDTEVILAAWLAWGPRCVEHMNGIFAFALLDDRRLFLARDHVGVKPLFYAVHDGVLRFGSELKAILADPAVPRAPDLDAIDCFLTHAFVPHPRSPFQGVAQLPPASTLVADVGAATRPRIARYWQPRVSEGRINGHEALAALQAQLRESVAAQMVSDVPLGAFLSGGLDSASIVGEMVRTATREPVRTFSLGFAQASFDERAAARHTARVLGAEHHADEVALDLRAAVLDVADQNDDLLADSSMLAVDQLCRMTRKHVTVALSGDGADELLAGYPTYAATYLARAWRGAVPSRVRRLAKGAALRLPPSTERYNVRELALRFLGGAERGAGRDFASWRVYLDDDDRRALCRASFHADGDAIGQYARALDEAGAHATLLKRMLVADLLYYLPNDMLVKVDRASMRHALEVRVPFLDPRFIDLALSLPSHLLLSRTGTTKALLRRHVAQRISPEIARGKKRGFNVPLSAAFRSGALSALLLDAVGTEPFKSSGPIDAAAVERRVAAHRRGETDAGFVLYALLALALWWNRFLPRP